MTITMQDMSGLDRLPINGRAILVMPERVRELAAKLSADTWVEKRAKTPTTADRTMRQFVDGFAYGYELVYGITWRNQDYDCGSMPRDIGRVLRGMEIVRDAGER